MKVVLLSPPWRWPDSPCLATATLHALLERQGFDVSNIHGSIFFPPPDVRYDIFNTASTLLFVPSLYPNLDPADTAAKMIRDGCPPEIADELLRRAAICMDRIIEEVLSRNPDVVGMSTTFYHQLPGALAVARRLKEQRPSIKIMLGGAACFAEQAEGLIASFPTLDAVCHTEGESVIGPLVRGLVQGTDLGEVPGIVYRDAAGNVRKTGNPPALLNMDDLPMPNYDGYYEQLVKSEWARASKLRSFPASRLYFETSRECWWGDKHMCTFCGLNPVGIGYRKKSAARAVQEIIALYERYPGAAVLEATDNILDMDYIKTVLPHLKPYTKKSRPLRMFFEVKSNLRRDQVQALSDSGIRAVQPGIESFNTDVLKLMRKGCTALQQVRMVKWASEAGIVLIYQILYGSPGEKAEWYREMTDLIPYIEHLYPPPGIGPVELVRFSPYMAEAANFNITNIRPSAMYHDMYPDPSVDLVRIAYSFDFDHPMHHDEPLKAAVAELATTVMRWVRRWYRDMTVYAECGDGIMVSDGRTAEPRNHTLAGAAQSLWRYFDDIHHRPALYRTFPKLDEEVLEALIDTWHHRRWLAIEADGHMIVTVPQRQPETTAQPKRAPSMMVYDAV